MLGRILETVVVHTVAGAVSRGLEKVLDPAARKARRLYKQATTPIDERPEPEEVEKKEKVL